MVRRRSRAGQALVFTTLGLIFLLGVVGLGVDMGNLRLAKRRMQSAADAAAIAGQSGRRYGYSITAAAKADSATNGFTDGANGVTVTVNNPPASGPNVGNANFVEVLISQSQPTFFMRVLGVNSATITARAVAGTRNGPGCIYALDPTATNAVLVNGSNITSQCGVLDDSNAGQALLVNGGSLAASSVGIVGGYSANGGTVSPTPTTGMVPAPDPLSYLTAPATSPCYKTNYLANGGSSVTVSPGVYCGTTIFNGVTNVILSAGLYVFTGNVIFNGVTTLSGNGVTLYNSSGSFTLNGIGKVNLTAPTTGTYAAILFYQDKSDSSAFTVNGNAGSSYQGALYFPKAAVTYNGDGNTAAYTILVADTITFNGNPYFNDDYSSLPGGSPIKSSTLAE